MNEPAATDPIRLHRQLTAVWGTGPGLGRLAAVNHAAACRLGQRSPPGDPSVGSESDPPEG